MARPRPASAVSPIAGALLALVLAACSGNDGTLVTRSTIALRGVAETASGPLAAVRCEAVTGAGTLVDDALTDDAGAFLLLVPEGFGGVVRCPAPGFVGLEVRTFVSTAGLSAGDDLGGLRADPGRTVLARALVHGQADDPAFDGPARIAALETALASDPGVGALADAYAAAFAELRVAGVDGDVETLLVDLFEDGTLDADVPDAVASAVDAAVVAIEQARGTTLPEAFAALYTGPTLTLLHHSGAASALRGAGEAFPDAGGVARFATVLERLREEARSVLYVNAGDTIAPGPELSVSLEAAAERYDSRVLERLRPDVALVGTSDLALGPSLFAGIVEDAEPPVPFLGTNLGVAQEPAFAALIDEGRLPDSVLLEVAARRVGLVGAISPTLGRRTAVRGLVPPAEDELVPGIQQRIEQLRAAGARLVIVVGQLEDLAAHRALAEQLSGVDVLVAGGGDPLLADDSDRLVPGDEGAVAGPYPIELTDAEGNPVALVGTAGRYRYLGRLEARFDAFGRLEALGDGSGPVRVVGGGAPDAAEPDNDVEANVLGPLRQDLATLRDARAADSAVALDATAAGLGAGETNFGDLLADAAFLAARGVASSFGAPAPAAGLVEAGVVDADRRVAAGTLTRGDLFELAPRDRLLAVLAAVPAERVKALLEHAVAGGGGERFLQVANLTVELDLARPARTVDPDGTVVEPGARVRRVVVGASQVLVEDGAVVAGAPTVALAVTDTLARGERAFPIGGAEFRILGVDLRQALDNLLLTRLGGSIRAADYPEGGVGRITVTGAP